MKNKKADLTSTQIITIVLLVIGFVIVLFFFWQLSWSGTADTETCHQSVILRGTLPSIAENFIPLKCRTTKNCITSGLIGGKCSAFQGETGITKVKVKTANDINKFIAQEAVGCWQMMGEGKVSLFTQWAAKTYGVGDVYSTCVICSRIAFDTANLNPTELANMNVADYMIRYKMPGREVSYYDYFIGEGGTPPTIDAGYIDVVKSGITKFATDAPIADAENNKLGINIQQRQTISTSANSINIDSSYAEAPQNEEVAILFMQISAPEYWDSMKNIGLTLAGASAGGFLASPSLTTKGAKLGVQIVTKHPIITAIVVVAGLAIHGANVADNQNIAAGYCGDVSGAESRYGCSVVRVVKYDMSSIAQYCEEIAGIS